MIPRPPSSTLIPYTTLFRSLRTRDEHRDAVGRHHGESEAGLSGIQGVPFAADPCLRRQWPAAGSEEPTPELQSPDHPLYPPLLPKQHLSHPPHTPPARPHPH